MSLYLNKTVAEVACQIAWPTIEALLQKKAKRQHFHLLVLDPTARYGVVDFERAILFECPVGESEWEWPYRDFARAKARLSYRTGLPSARAVLEYPHLLEEGDVKYGGSAIFRRIITAGSGVEAYFDATCARLYAILCHSLATHEVQSLLRDESRVYVGQQSS